MRDSAALKSAFPAVLREHQRGRSHPAGEYAFVPHPFLPGAECACAQKYGIPSVQTRRGDRIRRVCAHDRSARHLHMRQLLPANYRRYVRVFMAVHAARVKFPAAASCFILPRGFLSAVLREQVFPFVPPRRPRDRWPPVPYSRVHIYLYCPTRGTARGIRRAFQQRVSSAAVF